MALVEGIALAVLATVPAAPPEQLPDTSIGRAAQTCRQANEFFAGAVFDDGHSVVAEGGDLACLVEQLALPEWLFIFNGAGVWRFGDYTVIAEGGDGDTVIATGDAAPA